MAQFGRFDEALELCRRAIHVDPFNYPNRSGTALYLYFANRYREAESLLKSLLSEKDLLMAHVILGDVYGRLAMDVPASESEQLVSKARSRSRNSRSQGAKRAVSPMNPEVAGASDVMFAGSVIDRQGPRNPPGSLCQPPRAGGRGPRYSSPLAEIYCVQGKRGQALRHLRRAFETRDRQLLYMKVNPFLRPLHDDKEFQAILQYMRL